MAKIRTTLNSFLGRLTGRASRAQAGGGVNYAARVVNEKAFYADCEEVHNLPPIFHYWSNRYLRPMLEPHGFSHPNDFFLKFIRRRCRAEPGKVQTLVSIGSGNADTEVYIGRQLSKSGIDNFHFVCVEINTDMVRRGRELVQDAGLSEQFGFLIEDFNQWRPEPASIDIVMANQSLHHVLELEHLFESIRQGLVEDGVLLNSDMIGRNGHMRWPEALERVHAFWEELPQEYRFNRLLERQEELYVNHDCSTEGFEGIRAQDILPLMIRYFHFSLFIPYGNVIFPFVDRAFGHNFNAEGEWDRDFIDRIHAEDEKGFQDGSLKPTSMLAAMTVKPSVTQLRDAKLTPEFCVRDPAA